MLPLQASQSTSLPGSSSSFASIGEGAPGWHGAGQRQRALKIAAGRRSFAQLSIVFLGEHQKPLSREQVGLSGQIAGPLCKGPVELAIHDVASLNDTRIALKYIDGSDVKAGEQGGPFEEVLPRACSSRSG
ncbi:hypothetical protein, partial [Bradyrhizobium sp. 162]|uniref:hypothetical protein n=1 Tax=Bradyrhizobium sp. 162 TaxID=2782635 RepID=UPI0032080897